MLGGWPRGGIRLSTEPADMRRSFDGLCALVATRLGRDPAGDRWQLFASRRRTLIKVPGFERGGFLLWSKRLEQGLFAPPPATGQAAPALSSTGPAALIDGIDAAVRRRRKRCDGPRAVSGSGRSRTTAGSTLPAIGLSAKSSFHRRGAGSRIRSAGRVSMRCRTSAGCARGLIPCMKRAATRLSAMPASRPPASVRETAGSSARA